MTGIWTAPTIERIEPDFVADERTSLEQWLDYHRATLLTKCAGLTAEQLKRRAVPPSRLSLLGLVRHMVEVERWWFRMYAAQQDIDFPYDPDSVGLDFEEVDEADAAADLAAFEEECEAARDAMAGRSLDDVVRFRGDRPRRDRDVHWIFVHMIEEYARHNGHADLLREAIDGVTGE
jgi:uncharacterized damage-inducible protein DinB